ncbi:MAG: hypothetical protein ACRCSK_01480 [Fusobacteriaceae bacterium]
MKALGFILILIGLFMFWLHPVVGILPIFLGICFFIFGKSGTQKAVEKQSEIIEQSRKNNQSILSNDERQLRVARLTKLYCDEGMPILEAKTKAEMEEILEFNGQK